MWGIGTAMEVRLKDRGAGIPQAISDEHRVWSLVDCENRTVSGLMVMYITFSASACSESLIRSTYYLLQSHPESPSSKDVV